MESVLRVSWRVDLEFEDLRKHLPCLVGFFMLGARRSSCLFGFAAWRFFSVVLDWTGRAHYNYILAADVGKGGLRMFY